MLTKAPVGASKAPVARALKEAAVTGLLAVALFLPLVSMIESVASSKMG